MYAKVFTQIYDGTLCTKGPWQALVTFQQLLVLADRDGNVDMTAAAIARRTTIPLEIIELGIAELLKPDPESRTPTEEGRRIVPLADGRSWGWRIVNYTHYRELKREEDRRQYHRDYWHKRKLKDEAATQQTQHDSSHSTKSTEAYAEAEAKADTSSLRSDVERKRSVPVRRPDDVDEQVWVDWCDLRKGHKAKVSETAVGQARKEAEKAGMSLDAFLRVWCVRGSRGLQADWIKPHERQGYSRTPTAAEQRVMQAAPGLAAPHLRQPTIQTLDFVEEVQHEPAYRLGR